ncbi:MAG TPA: phosphodiester glycosidase family protein [Xanthobacteraceae bacterium]
MRRWLLATTVLVAFVAQAKTQTISQSGFSPLYVGVDFETATLPTNPTTPGGPPTTSRAYITRIDLKAPDIALITTPHSGPLNTTSETISQFAADKGVRIAINANFFAPCCDAFPEPKTVIGLLVSQGQVVAPLSFDPLNSEAVLAFSPNNEAVIAQSPSINLARVYNAVAGSAIIVQNGQDVSASSPNEGDPADPNPRTLTGLSRHGRYLYLVVIDGRVPGYSIGTTNEQSAQLMLALGCYSALNLDGGGSTEMVRADVLGHPYIVNNPSGGAERYDAAALGVYADPLPGNSPFKSADEDAN